jgi:hypothetical protein
MTREGGTTVTNGLKLHREIVGAVLSIRYDLERRRHKRRADALARAETADYSRIALDPRRPQRGPRLEPQRRQQRRVVAPAGVALLVAGGAAGTYLAVAGSLTAITTDPPGTPVAQPVPPTATSGPVATTGTSPKRPAKVRRPDRRPAVPVPVPVPAVVVTPGPTVIPGGGTPENTKPPQPTPSASATATPTPTASAAASPTSYPTARHRWGRHGRPRAEATPTPTQQVTPHTPSHTPTPAPSLPTGDSRAGH